MRASDLADRLNDEFTARGDGFKAVKLTGSFSRDRSVALSDGSVLVLGRQTRIPIVDRHRAGYSFSTRLDIVYKSDKDRVRAFNCILSLRIMDGMVCVTTTTRRVCGVVPVPCSPVRWFYDAIAPVNSESARVISAARAVLCDQWNDYYYAEGKGGALLAGRYKAGFVYVDCLTDVREAAVCLEPHLPLDVVGLCASYMSNHSDLVISPADASIGRSSLPTKSELQEQKKAKAIERKRITLKRKLSRMEADDLNHRQLQTKVRDRRIELDKLVAAVTRFESEAPEREAKRAKLTHELAQLGQ